MNLKNKNGSIIITIVIIIAMVIFLTIYITKENSKNVSQVIIRNIETAIEEIGLDKSKIMNVLSDGEWASGIRYTVDYDNQLLYVFAFDNGDISSIQDEQRHTIYKNENATGVDSNNIDDNSIVLIYNELGECGKNDIYDNEEYIRYYVPEGIYTVKALTRNAQFFIEKKRIYTNSSGYQESETVRHIKMGDINSTDTIEIKSDECISLTMFSSVTLIPQ